MTLDALRAGAGQRNDELDITPPGSWAAANRFVLDILSSKRRPLACRAPRTP